MKRFLLIQIRPEDEAAENELESFLKFGDLGPHEIVRHQIDRKPLDSIDCDKYSGIILGGGPANISDQHKSPERIRMDNDLLMIIQQVIDQDVPFFGACYGIGALIATLGGSVSKKRFSEPVGAVRIMLNESGQSDPLLHNLPSSFFAFAGHKEACQTLPKEATLLASSTTCPIQMVRVKNNVYATQFHPELDTAGLIVRINVYKHAGYFPPEEAEYLIEKARRENVEMPVRILQNFVKRYRS